MPKRERQCCHFPAPPHPRISLTWGSKLTEKGRNPFAQDSFMQVVCRRLATLHRSFVFEYLKWPELALPLIFYVIVPVFSKAWLKRLLLHLFYGFYRNKLPPEKFASHTSIEVCFSQWLDYMLGKPTSTGIFLSHKISRPRNPHKPSHTVPLSSYFPPCCGLNKTAWWAWVPF